jgi:uncharacterized membrane protein HdeD (DUF308 family)
MRHRWGWFVALGIALIVLGAIAFFNTLLATVASVYTVAILMLIGGAAQIAHAFGVKTWSGFFWWLGAGVIYALGGLFALFNPLLASAILTLLLASALIVGGALRIIVAIRERPRRHWGWVLAAGVVTLLAGLVIALGWPVSSLWVLGLFLAVDLTFQGWAMVAVGLALRRGDTSAATV